jgi:hypothetical protein
LRTGWQVAMISELEIRLSGEQEIRWQAIRTAGYQVKE